MKSVKRCPECAGGKQVLSLGGMFKSCKSCKGIGFVEKVDDADVDQFLAQPEPKSKKKKKKARVLHVDEVNHGAAAV